MYTHVVMFQKGHRVGARSLRIEYVTAKTDAAAIKAAKLLFPEWKAQGYYVYRCKEEREADFHDPENIYNLPSIRQSIEEDRK